jgi:hypothetical protein
MLLDEQSVVARCRDRRQKMLLLTLIVTIIADTTVILALLRICCDIASLICQLHVCCINPFVLLERGISNALVVASTDTTAVFIVHHQRSFIAETHSL